MKKLIVAALTSVLSISTVYAEAILYGKANLSLQQVDDGTDSAWEVESNSSRFGLKGKHALENDLSVIYRYELAIDLADNPNGSDDLLKARNQYAGLKGDFGTVIIGRHDTPLKRAQGKFDQFGNVELGDIKTIIRSIENRENSVVQYTSPKIADAFTAKVMILPEGGDAADTGLADATSVSLAYQQGGLYLALGLDSDVEEAGLDSQLISAGWKSANYGVNALINTSDLEGADEETATGVSAFYKQGKLKYKAQFLSVENVNNVSNADADAVSLGLDYKLGKKTTLGFFTVDLEEESNTGISFITKF